MSVRFQFDWVDAGPPPDKLAQFTMATFSVCVGDAVVTSVLDRERRIYREEVVVPLFNVAEWLVTNWWHIWYEVGDAAVSTPDFESRHNLAFAGDGFVLPNLRMTPSSGRTRLAWNRYKPKYARIEFVDEGQHDVERAELELEFRRLIDAVLDRLHGQPECAAAAGSLGRAWTAIDDLDDEELEFSRAAALVGVDPFDAPDQVADAIVAFCERVDPSIRDDALALASDGLLAGVSRWLGHAADALAREPQDSAWAEVRSTLSLPTAAEPWLRGYDLARSVRDTLGLDDRPIDPSKLDGLAIPRWDTEPPSGRIHGLVGTDSPACVTAPRGPVGVRFLVARALGEYLSRRVPGHGLLSSLATDGQAQSRAFAAEFLSPARALRKRIQGDAVSVEDTDELATEFGVSSELVRRQIENHGIATIVDP